MATPLTTRQVAERLGVTPRQVQRLIAAGRLRATPITSRLFLVAERDLAAYRPRPRGRPKGE